MNGSNNSLKRYVNIQRGAISGEKPCIGCSSKFSDYQDYGNPPTPIIYMHSTKLGSGSVDIFV
jgi:hypothetical protein